MKLLTLLTSLVAVLALADMTLADPERGWRPGADAFGSTDTQRIAHYSSPGLLPGDKVTLSFGISGHFPISLYNVMGDPEAAMAGFDRLHLEYPEEMIAYTEDCVVNTGSFMMDEQMQLCIIERVYADATLGLSILVDVSDMLSSENPATAVRSLGIKHKGTGAYLPLIEARSGEICSGPEEASICASCYRDFRSLAAGEAGGTCGDADMEHGLIAVDVQMPYFALVFHMAANQADFGPWELALRLDTLSAQTFDVTYTSDDLLAALFGPGG